MKGFVQIILSSLYIYSSNISWAVLSYPSKDPELNSLNVASPSLTSEYWISTFKAYARPVFEGNFPSWAEYSSLSAYDDFGVLIPGSSYNSAQTGFENGTIDLLRDVDDSFLSRPYAVIHRVYRPPGRNESLQDNEKFKVTVYNYIQPVATEEEARNNGKQLESQLQKSLGKIHADFYSDTRLYKPSSGNMPGLFGNGDAIYLITSPSRQRVGLRINGILGNQPEWIKYIGYMTTDMYTTATSDGYELQWNQPYSIFIFKAGYDPEKYGYNASDKDNHVIYWNEGAIFPTVVLRIIDVSCSTGDCKYNLQEDSYIPPTVCQLSLKELYPIEIKYF